MSQGSAAVIRVLVVEDSRVIAEFLTHLLNSDRRIRVVGVAFDGDEAVEAARRTRPDVITMDIHMPKLNGFDATRRIMETCPAPIVIVSGTTSTDEVALNFRAIEAGALAVVMRPNVSDDPGRGPARQLLDTIKLMSEVKVVRRWSRLRPVAMPPPPPVVLDARPASQPRIVAVGASTGGPLALQTLLRGLPADFPLPLVIVQHMTAGFVGGFVEWLANAARFPVRVAAAGEVVRPGCAYIAPDHFHLCMQQGERISLSAQPAEHGVRPAVAFLFRSVRQVYGSAAIAVLLTGMGRDGADDLKELKDAGAITIAQDEASSVVHGMPGEAIHLDAARYVLAPEDIAKTLCSIAGKP